MGAPSGAHSEETGKCRDSSKKRIFFDTQLPAHYIYSSQRCTQCYLQGRALLLLTQNKASLGRQAFLRGGWAGLPGEGRVCRWNTSHLRSGFSSVTAPRFCTSRPLGTDTLKSHLLGSEGKTNLITAFVIQESPWVSWVS